mgnify:CR=1 FL=1
MIAEKVQELEQENIVLKEQLRKLQGICSSVEVPKNCEYCENFIQHYFKNGKSIIQHIMAVAKQEIG